MMNLSTSLMIPLTRLFGSLNSPVPRRFVTSFAIVPLQKTLPFTPGIRLSSPQFAKVASFATKLDPDPDPLTFTRPEGEQYVVVGYPGQGGKNVNSGQRRALPEEIAKRLRILTCDSTAKGAERGQCTVYLIGTYHGYEKSCREVEKVVCHLKPEVVFLELCFSRRKYLEMSSGSEFHVAFAEATKYGGKVILGDRPFEITVQRLWGELKLYHKAILCLAFPTNWPVLLQYLRIFRRQYLMKRTEKVYDKYDADEWKGFPWVKLFGLHKAYTDAVVVERDQ